MSIILNTERLQLKPFTHKDAPFIIELLNSPGWLQFIGDRNVHNEEEAVRYLENGPLKSYREYGFGLSKIEKKDTTEPIGMCGLLKRDTLENPDIGFALLPRFSGQGYASEIVNATILYAKEKLNIQKISAITLPHNLKSIRLLESIGFNFCKTIRMPGNNDDLRLYHL